jgi:pimeloyl-ACP methyl ester carboxylesterase
MKPLCDYLEKEGGYLVCNVEYPSTQGDVVEHAKALATIVENLDGIEQIHFVGHSLGNLVIRCYLAGSANGQGRALGSSENSENTEAAQGPDRGNRRHAPPGTVSHPLPDPRIRRFVMLAPPNHGSELAAALTDNGLFQAVAGEAGRQLGEEWPWLEANLAVPACGFGIIAGGLGDQAGYNPWLPGDDDGTITVEGTRLDGAKDFVVFPVTHSAMIRDRRVMSATLNFLRSERFSP